MAERFVDLDSGIYDNMDDEALDNVRAVLAYILMNDTDMDRDEIYDIIFRDEGGKIIWH